MKRLIQQSFMVLVVALLLMVQGCSSEKENIDRYIHKTKQKKSSPIEPLPSFAPPDKFSYPEGAKRRNPFEPYSKSSGKSGEAAPDQNRPKMPLEKFPLDALKFVGTLKDGNIKWGLIQQPDNKIVRVKAGDYMGENYGKILKITNSGLELRETIRVGGQWKRKKTTFRLKTQQKT